MQGEEPAIQAKCKVRNQPFKPPVASLWPNLVPKTLLQFFFFFLPGAPPVKPESLSMEKEEGSGSWLGPGSGCNWPCRLNFRNPCFGVSLPSVGPHLKT